MSDFPVIKFTVLFIIGILIHHLFDIDVIVIYYFFIALTLYTILYFTKIHVYIYKTKQILMFLLIILFGIFLSVINSNKTSRLPESIIHKKNTVIYGRVEKINLLQKGKLKFVIETDSILTAHSKVIGEFKLQCSVKEGKNNLIKLYNSIYPGYKIKIVRMIYLARDKRNPGEFDYSQYLLTKGITGVVNINDKKQIVIKEKNKRLYESIILDIRKSIANKIDELYSFQTASLLKGLLLADRSNISYTTKVEFINAGVIHVLAVSGLHVGFIALIIIILLGRINLFLRSILTIMCLFLFLIITGAPPSVLRAVIMGTVIILSFIFVRVNNIFNSLALAAFIILLFNPQQLFAPGFQLSFSAVWGIAVFYPIFSDLISTFKIRSKSFKYVLLFLSVSLGAQIGTLPFTLIYFGKLSVIALFINLVVIPIIGVIIATGIVTLFFSLFSYWLATIYSYANEIFSNIIFGIISTSGNLSVSFIRITNFNYFDALIIFLFIFIFLFCLKKIKNLVPLIIIIFLIISNIFLYTSLTKRELLPENTLSLLMVDVGQGDAILIKYPNGKTTLIDAGIKVNNYDTGEFILEPLLNYLHIDKIDLAFISHMDIDHYGGFSYLISKGYISEIIKPAYDSLISNEIRFEKLSKMNQINVGNYNQQIIREGNVNLYILNNSNNINYQKLSGNNKSGMIKIVYGNNSILFTGDIENKGEDLYDVYYKGFLRSDILKVPHHGSKTSSTEAFLQLIKPKYALISVGKYNKYKHPSNVVINRYKMKNINIYRTDELGAILFQSDGIKIKEINWRE